MSKFYSHLAKTISTRIVIMVFALTLIGILLNIYILLSSVE